MKILAAVVLVVLAGSGPCDRSSAPPGPGETVQIKGTLTAEGVECQAMRDARNVLYTLAGTTGGFKNGDQVCVKGRIAEVSTCQQGTTIAVESIQAASECD